MRKCLCSTKHVPAPVELVFEEGPGVWLCPTAAVNLHSLLVCWQQYGGEPPGSVTKHYGAYIRGLARDLEVC